MSPIHHGGVRAIAVATLVGVLLASTTCALRAHGNRPHPAPPGEVASSPARSERFDFEAPRPGSYRLPIVKPAADGAVLDATGTVRRLHDVLAGQIVVLSFVYTRCSDVNGCPLATAVLHQIHAATAGDPELARHLKLATLSFDPEHDTPAVMARYGPDGAAETQQRSVWERLTTASAQELAPILVGYGHVVERLPDPLAGPTHLLRVYLIDRQQRIRNIYGLDFLDPRLLLADVRTLLIEERGQPR